uniref:CNMamide n=2 Tax=Lygus hesperus TaxID=30085 RepID=A0A7T7VNL3_LYGHE|nr:CNMamide precursor [Lygus hesperus]
MGVAQPVLVCAVLLGLLTPTPAASAPDDGQSLSIQDIVSFLDYLQNKGMHVDWAGARQRGFQTPQAYNENYLDDLKTNEIDTEQGETSPMNKRASYMTLCHFKICNMGRKRGFIRKASHNFLRRI